ncbi:partial Efflux pump periplasmic linker BepF, partial [Candidatus Brocadiaceae bacterium]
ARIRANVANESGLVVPQVAVMQLQTATQLAVVNKEDKVEMRTVKLGVTSGKLVVVKEGVKLGERVIAEGGQKVREGMKVQPTAYTVKAE